ncbi:potassium channel family protein [Actinomycetospora sp.]|uniref:potassium channel family protein n=1 Tax=Actinomycetospora sp. TaxID=1872135 RepID=UPI002F3EA847
MAHVRGGAAGRVIATVLRSTITVVLLGWLYTVFPLRTRPDLVTLVELVLGLLALGVTAAWQIRGITRSPWPALRAIEAFAMTVPLFVVLFSAAYVVVDGSWPGSFNQPLDRVAALYFTMTVLATVGFGDIVAVTTAARLLVVGQMVLDLVLVGLVVRAMLDAVRRGRERTARAQGSAAARDEQTDHEPDDEHEGERRPQRHRHDGDEDPDRRRSGVLDDEHDREDREDPSHDQAGASGRRAGGRA